MPFIRLVFILSLNLSSLNAFGVDPPKLYYRYKSENGSTVISSTLPSEQANKGYSVTDKHGVVIQKVLPVPYQNEEQKIRNKMIIDQKRKEARLLKLYGSAASAETAQYRNAAQYNMKLDILQSNLKAHKKQLEMLETKIAESQRKDTPPQELIQEHQLSHDKLLEIEKNQQVVEKEKQEAMNKYAQDIAILKRIEQEILVKTPATQN